MVFHWGLMISSFFGYFEGRFDSLSSLISWTRIYNSRDSETIISLIKYLLYYCKATIYYKLPASIVESLISKVKAVAC